MPKKVHLAELCELLEQTVAEIVDTIRIFRPMMRFRRTAIVRFLN